MVKKNREERRHEKFGGGRASEHGGWPSSRPNPVFQTDANPEEATPDTADQRPPDEPGPVGGKATKPPGRTRRDEDTSPRDGTKS
jgi:hypothetical protein